MKLLRIIPLASAVASNLDAMVVRLAPGGTVVDRKLYDVGGPNEALSGAAFDGSRIAAVGYVGRANDGGGKDDDAVLWLQP
jgi:hypothetical protein